jgi:PEGA domain-containing protein
LPSPSDEKGQPALTTRARAVSIAEELAQSEVQEIRTLDPDIDLDMFIGEPSRALTAAAASRRLEASEGPTTPRHARPLTSVSVHPSRRLSELGVSAWFAMASLAVIAGAIWIGMLRVDPVDSASMPPPAQIAAITSASNLTPDHAEAPDAPREERTSTVGETPVMPPPVVPAIEETAGWLRVQSPIDLDISSEGHIIGTSRADRTMLPTGRHDLVFSNERIGYRGSQKVTVIPGETQTIQVRILGGTVSVNAQPWAEVSIDGKAVGETPFANMAIAAGVHEIVFTHPQFGERRIETVVRSGQHVRLGVDLRTP